MADDPREVAFNPAAPASERFDANAELSRVYRPLASELVPPAELQVVIDAIQAGMENAAFTKAANVVQFPGRVRPPPREGMRSLYLDDLQIFASGEYWEKPSPLGFDSLRQMVDQTPILSSIVLTRIRQVTRFCAPSEDGGLGFEIRHRDREEQPNEKSKASFNLLSRFFQHTGFEWNPRERKKLKRDGMTGFMAKLIRDSLTMDAAPIETEFRRDRSLGISGLYAVDGATIRLCTDEGYEGDDSIFAVQVSQGRLATTYTHDQLIYEVRNPRTDVRLAGYGMGETELLVRIVTGFLNALTMNIKGFDENAIPKGLLHLSGSYSKEDLAAFKRMWNAQVRGVNNAWSLPVMVSADQESRAAFERFGIDFNEMMFSKWMIFLTSIACAIYSMSPDEINFESFSARTSSLAGSDTEEKLADSKDKGLRPLMSYFEQVFSDYIVADFEPDYVFRWTGLDPQDQAQEWEAKKLVMTVDELRAEKGLDKHPDQQLGSAPLNPSLVGPWMQFQQAQQQPDFGQEQGGPGEDAGGAGAGFKDGTEEQDAQGGNMVQPQDAPTQQGQKPETEDFGGDEPQGDFGKAFTSIFAVR